MNVTISPSRAQGEVMAPPSKSMAHRALIGAAFAPGKSVLSPIALSEDMHATIDCLTALGASFSREGDRVTVQGVAFPHSTGQVLPCRESGSTLRFMIPLCLMTGQRIILTGTPRLMERPLTVYEDLCREKGFFFEKKGTTLTLEGRLQSGSYQIDGSVSSQFITGLLYALSLLPGESRLEVVGHWESASYVDMTLVSMASFGVNVRREGQVFYLEGSALYRPGEYRVEGDWSNAAFLEALNHLGGLVAVQGVREDSLQGDRVCRQALAQLKEGNCEIDLVNCPDLAPILFAMASLFHGATFTGTRRLRIKESDRGLAMAEELKKCGIDLVIEENRILVPAGPLTPPQEKISSHNDHRIAMAMAILLTRLGGSIEGAEAVNKSYPDFFETLEKLGIEVKK